MTLPKTSDLSKRSGWILLIAIVVQLAYLYGSAVANGVFWELGNDSDDLMRFVQIRDWLDGQSWFVTNQYRLGLAAGTDMHWSRLPDVPVAVLTWIFDMFMSREQAFNLAVAIWPPVVGALLLVIMAKGADTLSGLKSRTGAKTAVLLLTAIFVCLSPRFRPGSLDHHNIQMVLLACVVVALLSTHKFKSGLLAGGAAGAAFAIGPEVYPFIAIIGIFVALDWVCLSEARRLRTQGFGLGFGLSLALIFIGTVGPQDRGIIYCDQLSVVNVLAAIVAGLGLSLSATLKAQKQILMRFLCLVFIGVVVLAIVIKMAPECLGNPLNNLPPEMRTFWLDHIREAKSLSETPRPIHSLIYYIGTCSVALLVLCHRIWRNGLSSRRVLFVLMLLISLGFTVYQVRFFVFAQLFAILPLGLWIAACHANGKTKERNLAYLGATVLSIPFFLTLPVLIFESNAPSANEDKKIECMMPEVVAAYNDLPAGRVLARTTDGSVLIKETDHHVIAANYHRNIDGIGASIAINSAEPNQAKALMKTYDIDYLGTCVNDVVGKLYEEKYPEGLAAKLRKGETFDWLVPIQAEFDNVKIYRVED